MDEPVIGVACGPQANVVDADSVAEREPKRITIRVAEYEPELTCAVRVAICVAVDVALCVAIRGADEVALHDAVGLGL